MSKRHHSDYDDFTISRCERALVTLLGDIGPWSRRVYLVGGLAPRYIIGSLPDGASPHVGTTDVDLVIALTLSDESPEAYRTLENNLRKANFRDETSFRWTRNVDGINVIVEFLCETDKVEPGKIFKPKQGAGSGLGAFNVPGAQLVARDFTEIEIEADRLDDGGRSKVLVRVAGILSYTVLKTLGTAKNTNLKITSPRSTTTTKINNNKPQRRHTLVSRASRGSLALALAGSPPLRRSRQRQTPTVEARAETLRALRDGSDLMADETLRSRRAKCPPRSAARLPSTSADSSGQQRQANADGRPAWD